MLRLPPVTASFPRTVDEALTQKSEHGAAAAFVAGGTDLYPNMKRRVQTPAHIILVIGACVTLTELIRSESVRQGWQVISEAASVISTPLLQNMGTVGGNLLLDTRCNYYDQGYEDQLLHEERRRHLLGGALLTALLGGAIE